MKKIIILLMSAILTTSCFSENNMIPWGIYNGMINQAPEGSDVFRKAWKDGCHSGLSAYGSTWYKIMYQYRYDSRYINNDEYHDAWKIGFRHCRWYIDSWLYN